MKNLKITLFLFCLSTLTVANAIEIGDKGYRLSSTAVIKDYTLFRSSPTISFLTSYIVKTNPRIVRTEAREIASHILNVSSCFEIDPWILTALIQKESTFEKTATSPTNAAGLTQFTTIGFKEVHDQLGFRGREGASENATLYFTSKIRSCIDPSWVDLWARVDVSPTHPAYYNLLKNELRRDTLTSITYGAILLKTYIAYVDNKNNKLGLTNNLLKTYNANLDSKNENMLSDSELYYMALQIYNGEPGEAKVRYAKTIFKFVQRAYPTPLSFPFLEI